MTIGVLQLERVIFLPMCDTKIVFIAKKNLGSSLTAILIDTDNQKINIAV